MRRVLTGAVDAGLADASLRAIAAFDDLVAEGGTLQQLTSLASTMLGREVCLRDDLLDRLVRAGASADADLTHLDQLAWQLGSRLERSAGRRDRPRRAAVRGRRHRACRRAAGDGVDGPLRGHLQPSR